MHLTRAIIRHFDPFTYRADVEIAGAPGALLTGVPVALDLSPDLLSEGRKVLLCLSDEGNPADGAVIAPYGGVPE